MTNPMTGEQDEVAAMLHSAARRVETVLEAAGHRVLAAASGLRVASGMAGLASQAKPLEDAKAVLARVQDALRNGQPEMLTRRERRVACALFDALGPADLGRVLVGMREWRVFIDALFSRRHVMSADEFRRWEKLLRSAPADLALLAEEGLQRPLLEADTSHSAAQTALLYGREPSLDRLLQAATGRERLSPRWHYTSSVVGFWLLRNAEPREERWAEIKSDVRLEAMLLPRAREVTGSAFDRTGKTPLPAGIPDNPLAQAAAVSALLLPGVGQALSAESEAKLRELVFHSAFRDPREFRDPRMAPETVGWQHVRALSPKGYDSFLEKLISEDMQVFFEYIETDQNRGRFWRQFLKHISGTGFFLSDETKDRLSRVFTGSHPEMKARLKRTNRLLDQRKGDAFYLMFRNHVVVEFSQKGNAAFVYDRAVFERSLLKNAMWISQLKQAGCLERLMHHERWEQRFRERLTALGAVWSYGGSGGQPGGSSRPSSSASTRQPRFSVSRSQNTVIDSAEGLEWQRKCDGNPCAPLAECQRFASLLYLDGSGWRLPTREELRTLAAAGVHHDPHLFPGMKRTLWTATMHPASKAAWVLDIVSIEGAFIDVSKRGFFCCVRSAR